MYHLKAGRHVQRDEASVWLQIRGGPWHAEWQAGPHSFICQCKLACPGLVSHVMVPMRANRCGIQPQSRSAAPSVHYFILLILLFDFIWLQVYIDTVGDAERYEASLGQRYPTIKCACLSDQSLTCIPSFSHEARIIEIVSCQHTCGYSWTFSPLEEIGRLTYILSLHPTQTSDSSHQPTAEPAPC